MSVEDLIITEVMYNPAPGGFSYIEVANTGTTAVDVTSFFVGNSDFIPLFFGDPGVPPGTTVPPGGTILFVPLPFEPVNATSSETQAQFELIYGPLPPDTVFISFVSFGPSGIEGGQTYTLGGIDLFIDSVFIPDIAEVGQSVSVTENPDGSKTTTAGEPSPGVFGGTEPEPEAGGVTLEGDDGADALVGTDEADAIFGGKGWDNLSGGGGDDTIDGGNQGDVIDGGSGNDELFGGYGNDTITGDFGDDTIYGGSNNDTIDGGSGNDTLYGDHGEDEIRGGGNDDVIFGGASDDNLRGNSGNDSIFGDSGNDVLRGNDGADYLDGGAQSDLMTGGGGNDTLIAGLGDDVMSGGADADTFVFAGVTNNDVITDFEVGIDTLDISALGPFSAMQVLGMLSEVDGNTVVDLGDVGSVTLQGVAMADLTLADFNFLEVEILMTTMG